MKKTYTISGMTCNSCKSTIHQNLNSIGELLSEKGLKEFIKGKNNEIEAILANLLVKLSSGPKTTLGLKIIVFLNIFFILFSASSLLLAYFECSPSYKPNAEK